MGKRKPFNVVSPKAWDDDNPIVRPPETMTVELDRKPVLYLPDGTVLVRKVGF